MLRFTIGLVNLDSVIDKYQTDVMSTTCCSPTDAISDWTLIVRRRFIATSFFLVAANAFCQSFCWFVGAATVNIFSSVNKNDANVTG